MKTLLYHYPDLEGYDAVYNTFPILKALRLMDLPAKHQKRVKGMKMPELILYLEKNNLERPLIILGAFIDKYLQTDPMPTVDVLDFTSKVRVNVREISRMEPSKMTHNDKYRFIRSVTGMWVYMVKDFDILDATDMESFFCYLYTTLQLGNVKERVKTFYERYGKISQRIPEYLACQSYSLQVAEGIQPSTIVINTIKTYGDDVGWIQYVLARGLKITNLPEELHQQFQCTEIPERLDNYVYNMSYMID